MRLTPSLLAIAAVLAVAAPAHAQYLQVPQGAVVDNSLDANSPPVHPHPVVPDQTVNQAAAQPTQKYETVSGGVTGEERSELDAAQRGKSVKLVFAATNGEYIGDTQVVIKTAQGKNAGEEVSNFHADGPYAFIALPAGSYTLTATSGGETRTQKITAGTSQKAYTIRFSPQ